MNLEVPPRVLVADRFQKLSHLEKLSLGRIAQLQDASYCSLARHGSQQFIARNFAEPGCLVIIKPVNDAEASFPHHQIVGMV